MLRPAVRAALPAAVFVTSLAGAAYADPLPCPTIDGTMICYDVTVTVDHLPDPLTGDLTATVTVTIDGYCASGGCVPIGTLDCAEDDVVCELLLDPHSTSQRTGIELGSPVVGTVPVTSIPVPRICTDDDPDATCVGGFSVPVDVPIVSGTVVTVHALGRAIPIRI